MSDMSKLIHLVLTVSMLTVMAGCAGTQTMPPAPPQTFSLARLLENPEEAAELGRLLQQGRPAIIRVAPGRKLPVHIEVNLPFGHLSSDQNELVFTKEVFLNLSESGLMISPDGQTWTPVRDLSGVKNAFGADKGRLDLGLQASEEKGAFISLVLEAE